MVVIHLDNNNKITMLEDKWKGDDQPSGWASKVNLNHGLPCNPANWYSL